MQSALYLTPGNDEANVENDGQLHVDEVYGLPLENMELVVLSACETNLGYLDREDPLANITAGDELVSLNRAFLFQSPTVISTLWTVDDKATSILMEKFYTELLNGHSKADALRLAQQVVREYGEEEYANPFFWAGFILSGDGGKIDQTLYEPSDVNTEEIVTESINEVEESKETDRADENASGPSEIEFDAVNENSLSDIQQPQLILVFVAILLLLGLIIGFIVRVIRS